MMLTMRSVCKPDMHGQPKLMQPYIRAEASLTPCKIHMYICFTITCVVNSPRVLVFVHIQPVSVPECTEILYHSYHW